MTQKRYTEKTVLITGAAQGVGKEIAYLFAEEGAHVFISDINADELKKLENIIKENGCRVTAMKADMSKVSDIQQFVDRAFDESEKIDILINNAAVSLTKKMMDVTEKDWDTVLNVNVKGTFFALQTVAKKMIERGNSGCIINMASIAGEKGRPLFLAYSASKAAVINITKSTALELAKYNIRVNAIAPGTIDTPMWQHIARALSEIHDSDIEALEKSWIEKIPLKRLATPKDIALLVLYLCSDDASYITGQTINICGGLSII